MKYLFLILFLVIIVAGEFAGLAKSEALRATSTRSAAELYAKKCSSCHGQDGRAKTFKGKLKHARDLTDGEWQDRVSDERIFNSTVNGKGGMPAFAKKLSEPEIDSLVTYVRGLRK